MILVSFSFGKSPFNAVQILLLNILINFFAAFALVSEYPDENVMPGPIDLSNLKVFTPYMCREILVQWIY